MELIQVRSSNLSKVGYDEESGTLVVVFKSGSTYEFEGVSREQFKSLLEAPSMGEFFSKNIRNRFVYKKIV